MLRYIYSILIIPLTAITNISKLFTNKCLYCLLTRIQSSIMTYLFSYICSTNMLSCGHESNYTRDKTNEPALTSIIVIVEQK